VEELQREQAVFDLHEGRGEGEGLPGHGLHFAGEEGVAQDPPQEDRVACVPGQGQEILQVRKGRPGGRHV